MTKDILLYKFKCSKLHVQYVLPSEAHCPKEGCGCIGTFECVCGQRMEFVGTAV